MPWGQFFTWIAQAFIVLLLLVVAILAIKEARK